VLGAKFKSEGQSLVLRASGTAAASLGAGSRVTLIDNNLHSAPVGFFFSEMEILINISELLIFGF
jgi:hypothetical protein